MTLTKIVPHPIDGYPVHEEATLEDLQAELAKYGRVDIPLEPTDEMLEGFHKEEAKAMFIRIYKGLLETARGTK